MLNLTRRDAWILIRGILIAVIVSVAISGSCAAIIASHEDHAVR